MDINKDNLGYDITYIKNDGAKKDIVSNNFPLLILDTYDVMGNNNYPNMNNVTGDDFEKFKEDYASNRDRIAKLKNLLIETKDLLSLKKNGSNIIIGADPYSTEDLGQEVFSKYNIRRILYNTILSEQHLGLDLKMYKNIMKLFSVNKDKLQKVIDFKELSKEDYRKELASFDDKEHKAHYIKGYNETKVLHGAYKYISKYNIDEEFIEDLKKNYVSNNFWFLWGASAGNWHFKIDKENENFFNGKILSVTKDGKVGKESRINLANSILTHYAKKGDTILIVNNQEGSILKDVALDYGCHVALLSSKEGLI